jgi:hypothetical protein
MGGAVLAPHYSSSAHPPADDEHRALAGEAFDSGPVADQL